jgi:DNA-binding MarR family transcriptional regulator
MARRYRYVMKHSEEPETTTTTSYETQPLGLALDFLRALWAINHGLATTSRYMKSKYGVTGRQRLIIQVVNEFPGISAGDLAKVLHLDPSTLTGVLQQMSRRGLLLLQPDPREPYGRRNHRSRRIQNALAGVAVQAQSHARGSGAPRRQFGSPCRGRSARRSRDVRVGF